LGTLAIPGIFGLFLVGTMGFELVRGMWGYRQPNKVSMIDANVSAE
jgi:hypothetical protein